MIDNRLPISGKSDLVALDTFLDFRMLSITRIVQAATEMIRAAGLNVGIDCLAPSLARMVGQDYQALDAHTDWIKASLYYQTLGPAGLPFELLALADWLTEHHSINQWNALMSLSDATRLPLPPNRAALREQGLTGEALGSEVWRARGASTQPLLCRHRSGTNTWHRRCIGVTTHRLSQHTQGNQPTRSGAGLGSAAYSSPTVRPGSAGLAK